MSEHTQEDVCVCVCVCVRIRLRVHVHAFSQARKLMFYICMNGYLMEADAHVNTTNLRTVDMLRFTTHRSKEVVLAGLEGQNLEELQDSWPPLALQCLWVSGHRAVSLCIRTGHSIALIHITSRVTYRGGFVILCPGCCFRVSHVRGEINSIA